MKTTDLKKSEIVASALRQMESEVSGDTISVREAVARTCRILYMFGFGRECGLAGQITARSHQPDTYWTQRLGLGFDEISEDGLLLVDEDLNVLEGSGMPNPANRFHSWVYRNHPEVNCIVHSHPFYSSTLAMLEVPLVISHMDTCVLYDQVNFVEKWPGIPVGNEEGEMISKALAEKKAVLLAHHGMLVAGRTVEEACVLSVMFEHAAEMQLKAMAAGTIQPIEPDLGREAQEWICTPRRTEATFAYYTRRARRAGLLG